jgi:hypothetical protein
MAPDELRAAVKAAVMEALADQDSCRRCCDSCDLDQHEHRDHHAALRGAFSARRQAVSAVVKLVAGGGALWLGLAVWEYFKLKAGK